MQRAIVIVMLAATAAAGAGAGFPAATVRTDPPSALAGRYARALERDCRFGLTPGSPERGLYRALVGALGPSGPEVQQPEAAFEQCLQAP